jgi:tripartite ATP-independent transporter DctP family solute receptor
MSGHPEPMVHTRRDLLRISAAGGIVAAVGLRGSRAGAQEKIQAKAGQAVARAYPYTAGIEDLIRRTNQGTGGRVDIQFFPDAQLGNERDLFEGLRLGTVQIAVGATGVLAGFAPEVQLLDLPFLYKDSAHIYKVADSMGWDLVKALPSKGIRVIAFYDGGQRQLFNRVRPVQAPEDLKGMKVRSLESPIHIAMWKAAGALPTPMPFGEVYTSLQQGVLDGADGSMTGFYTSKWYEVAKIGSLTRHIHQMAVVAVSEKWWSQLPENVRSVMTDAALKSQPLQRQAMTAEDAKSRTGAERDGVKFNETNRSLFQEKMGVVWDQFADKVGGKRRIDEALRMG